MCIVYIDDIDCFKFSIFHHQNGTRRINSELERFVEFYQNLMYGRGPQKMWGLVLENLSNRGTFTKLVPGGLIVGSGKVAMRKEKQASSILISFL